MPRCDFNTLKSHFGMRVLLDICCIFSEQLLLRISLDWRAASGQKIMAGLNNWLFFVDYKLIF